MRLCDHKVGRLVVSDLQSGRWVRPGFWCQPEAAPESAFEQLPTQPAQAPLEDAEQTRPWRGLGLRWTPQVSRRQAAQFGVLGPGPVGQHPEHRHRQHQPVSSHAPRVQPPGLVPLPAHSLERPKAKLDPDPKTVPPDADLLGGQVGQEHPGLFLVLPPDDDQRARSLSATILEDRGFAYPGMPRARHQLTGALAPLTYWLAGSPVLQAQERMPAQVPNALPETRTPEPAVGHDQHVKAGEHLPTHQAEQAQDLPHPGPFLVGWQDVPGNRDGCPAVEDTHRQPNHLVAPGGRVDCQRQFPSLPPGQNPDDERTEAQGDVDLGLAGSRLVLAIVEPLAQVLAQGVPVPNREQAGDHRVLAGAASQDRAIDPERQASLLSWTQVREALGNRLGHPVPFCWIAHGFAPASKLLPITMMPEHSALSQSHLQSFITTQSSYHYLDRPQLTYPCEPGGTTMPTPDFERLRTALLLRGEPDRVPLVEAGVEREIKEAFLGRPLRSLADEVEFWATAGYDY